MQTASEIQSAINNIRYYSDKIYKLARQQFELDASNPEINVTAGTIRFDSLGVIGANCNWINIYCDNMEINLKNAEKQDKELKKVEA